MQNDRAFKCSECGSCEYETELSLKICKKCAGGYKGHMFIEVLIKMYADWNNHNGTNGTAHQFIEWLKERISSEERTGK